MLLHSCNYVASLNLPFRCHDMFENWWIQQKYYVRLKDGANFEGGWWMCSAWKSTWEPINRVLSMRHNSASEPFQEKKNKSVTFSCHGSWPCWYTRVACFACNKCLHIIHDRWPMNIPCDGPSIHLLATPPLTLRLDNKSHLWSLWLVATAKPVAGLFPWRWLSLSFH